MRKEIWIVIPVFLDEADRVERVLDGYELKHVRMAPDKLSDTLEKERLQALLVEATDTLEECYMLLKEASADHRDGLANTADVVVSDSRALVAKSRRILRHTPYHEAAYEAHKRTL